MIYNSVTEVIGGTPLMRLWAIEKSQGAEAAVYGKLEAMNPAGSIKDRAALFMILEAEARGQLAPGGTVIEPVSYTHLLQYCGFPPECIRTRP